MTRCSTSVVAVPLDDPFVRRARLERETVPSFASYPFSIPAISRLSLLDFSAPVTFLAGENGSGKSTLIEGLAVALGFNAEGGSSNMTFTTRPSHSHLHEYLEIERGTRRERTGFFLRAESFFHVATHIEALDASPAGGPRLIGSYGGVSLHEQSHGESFLSLVMNRFGPRGSISSTSPRPRSRCAAASR